MRANFIDYVEIEVKAGNGGNGCTSFFHDRFNRFPKPDGGNGGNGGDVVLVADENVFTLLDLQYRKRFVAENGSHGEGNNKKGADGRACVVKVPVGTLVKDAKTGFTLRDLTHPGDKVIVAKGGKGGKGNRPKTPATKGEFGEERRLCLELKLIADVGLVGYPNVGKSTLFNRISSACSKVANYPFTTKAPVLGHVEIEEYDFTFTVADMPGLVEGAHKGKGLGHTFLRHIERTKVLVHILDISQPRSDNVYYDYLNLNKELFFYNPDLEKKPQLIVANKIDIPGSSENLKKLAQKINDKIYPVSARTGKGVVELLEAIKEILS